MLGSQSKQLHVWKIIKVRDKTQEVNYLVAKIIEPHTVAESLILSDYWAIVKTMFGKTAEKEINKIQLSYNTISRKFLYIKFNIIGRSKISNCISSG